MKPQNNYGLSIITGNFGSGKTFGIGIELYRLKQDNPDVCIISNVPWSITDIYYNSINDFEKVLDHLYQFYENTNNYLDDYNHTWKDIVLVMDESQIYFPARGFSDPKQKKLWEKLTIVLTQCRKRYTKIWCLTQRTKMIDLNFRRLADYIWFFNKSSLLGFKFCRLNIFQCGGVLSDLLGDDSTEFSSLEQLAEMDVNNNGIAWHQTDILQGLLMIFNKKWKLWKEKNITKHISGLLEDVYTLDYDSFVSKLYLNVKVLPVVSVYNQDKIPILFYGKKLVDFYGNTVIKNEKNNFQYVDS